MKTSKVISGVKHTATALSAGVLAIGRPAAAAGAAHAVTPVARTAPAAASPDRPTGATTLVPTGESDCGSVLHPCGIVYNRAGHTLELVRNSQSHLYCRNPSRFRNLPNGKNSNGHGSPRWKDTDCFRDNHGPVFINGRWYAKGQWIRVWTARWVY